MKLITVNWEDYFYGDGVLCEFRPRAEYNGRAMKPAIAEKAGLQLTLRPSWRMGVDDPYPGEYALSSINYDLMEQLGIPWVSSGDVVVVTEGDR